MNITKSRGGQAVAETETLPRPYFRKDGTFAGNLKEALRVTPTKKQLINVMRDCLRMNEESSGFECATSTWVNRCYNEIVWRLEEMAEVA